jgi:hypothetical protein
MGRHVSEEEMQGLQPIKMIPIEERKWHALRRILVRSSISFGHIARESFLILQSCRHAPECPKDHAVPCLESCPDREMWLSALVCYQNAKSFTDSAPNLTRASDGTYIPPTREYADKLIAELETMRAARDWVREFEQRLEVTPGVTPASAAGDPKADAMLLGMPNEKPKTRLVEPEPEPRLEDADEEETEL